MDRNFARALPLVLKWEGGWSDHPDDDGGPTNKGVTLATMRRYLKADATKDDLRKITDEQVATVYYRHYWSAVNAQAIPAGLDYALFDFAINSGPSRAAKFLQRIVGTNVDGRVGPKTVEAVNQLNTDDVIRHLCDERLAWLKRLKDWPVFGKGWTNRVVDVKRNALKMVGDPADVKEIPVPVPKPEVPKEIDTEVKKKTNRFGWLTSIFGGATGAGAAGIFGVEWETLAVFAAFVGGMVIMIVMFGNRLISFIDGVRKSTES